MTTKSLREWLQKNDPVRREPSLDSAAVERMRRQVLSADVGPCRRPIFPWLVRCVASAAIIAIIALLFRPRDGDHGTAGADLPGERTQPQAEPTTELASTATGHEAPAPTTAPVTTAGAAPGAPPTPSPVTEPTTVTTAAPVAGPVPPGPQLRQLQFTLAGGTRLIWLFDSDVDTEGTP